MSRNIKSILMIISPLIVIIGLISIVLTHSALTPPQLPAQTTSTTPIFPPSPVNLTETGLPIPEQFAAETSAFSEGIRINVGVNDTTPQVGGAVLMVIRITNVNSSEPVRFRYYGIGISVLNSEGVLVYGAKVIFPALTIKLDNGGFPINQTHTQILVWKVTPSSNTNVEFKPGESYDIVVSCGFQTRSGHQIRVSSTPIQVVVSN